MELWLEATAEMRKNRRTFRTSILFALVLVIVGITSLAFNAILAFHIFIIGGCAYLSYLFSLSIGPVDPSWRKLGKIQDVTADNPAVLRIVLDYLKREVLAPKEKFTTDTNKDVDALQAELDAFEADAAELQQNLANDHDEQMKTINQSISDTARLSDIPPAWSAEEGA
ncbi:MAG: hypothetical protein AAB669_01945 [Patescibacteria group bacterium]